MSRTTPLASATTVFSKYAYIKDKPISWTDPVRCNFRYLVRVEPVVALVPLTSLQ